MSTWLLRRSFGGSAGTWAVRAAVDMSAVGARRAGGPDLVFAEHLDEHGVQLVEVGVSAKDLPLPRAAAEHLRGQTAGRRGAARPELEGPVGWTDGPGSERA